MITLTELATQLEKVCGVAERLENIEGELRAIRAVIERRPQSATSPEKPKILLTFDDVAETLSVCRATVIELVKQGYLRATKIGRLTRIHRSDVEKLAKIGVPSVWSGKPWPEQRHMEGSS